MNPETLEWLREFYRNNSSVPNPNWVPTTYNKEISTLYDMPASRMRWMGSPFSYIHCRELGKDTVAVIVEASDDIVVLKDDATLFPSDALVTQLRILAN